MSRPSSNSARSAGIPDATRAAALRATTAASKVAKAPPPDLFSRYVATLDALVQSSTVTDVRGRALPLEKAVWDMGLGMRRAHDKGNRVFFVGNGGSAGICSHMATDCSKNGGIRSVALNDGSMLTCLANDFGYEHVFAKQLEWQARKGDVVVAISSSGKSPNILAAADVARRMGCRLFTYSGFGANNPLRGKGDVNVYVASHDYGFVEVGHLAIMHGVLDIQMGWGEEKPAGSRAPRGNGRHW